MKTATDILQEILANQVSLDKKAETTNFLLKTLLARLDQVSSNVEKSKKSETKRSPVIEQGNTIVAAAPMVQQSPPKEVSSITQTTSSIAEDKFPVVQQIKRNNVGVWLCNIVVTNSDGKVVFDGKSARNGQWTTVLPVGTYNLLITRGAGQEASEINISDTFTISSSKMKNGKITLPEIKL